MTSLLIHLSESTVVAAIVAFIIACMRRFRISAATRHTLWLLAFAKFVVPSSLLWSAGTSLASLITFHPTLQIPVVDFSRLLQNASAHTTLTSAVPGYAWVTILLASVWAAGSLLAFANWIRRLGRSTVSIGPASEPLQNALLRAKQQLSIRENVKVAISNEATDPVAMGIWRPVVVLPESLSDGLSAGELNAVLLHELAHVARRDNLTGALAHLISILFWFHPLLWWMERQLSMDCEYACDEVVLATARTPAEYASGILKATRFALEGAVAGILGMGGLALNKRLELILSQTENAVLPRVAHRIVAVAATALILIPILGGFASRSLLQAQTVEKRHGIEFISASAWANTPQAQQILSELKALLNPNDMVFPASGDSRWDKWLNEDVAFLITPEERAEFLALTSDAQRKQFVDQFWEKRNPDPGFGFNAFKQEHYRRIAYANDHFATRDAAGWQTDRGRTYIVMGPPHIRDVLADQQRERWRYPVRRTVDFITILFDVSEKAAF